MAKSILTPEGDLVNYDNLIAVSVEVRPVGVDEEHSEDEYCIVGTDVTNKENLLYHSPDYENGAKKTIDISIKAEKMTADVLKSALQEFMSGKAEKKGRMTYKQLQAKSPSKLDSIEVSDRNIGDFLKTARKYDVDFALKRDKSTSPPTYHVFFSAAKTEDFKRAFSEYVGKDQCKTPKRGEFTREKMQQQAQKLRSKPRKQKQREKTRENRR